MSRIELHSPMPPEHCAEVLRASIVNDWKWEGLGSGKWVAGSVGRTSLKLRKRTFYNNSFRTYLYASLAPEGSGARISVRYGMHPLVIAFMTLWLGIALLGLAADLFEGLRHPDTFSWAPLAMPLMGVAFVAVGRLLAYGDRSYLLDFLTTTLRAQSVGAPVPN